MVMIKKIIVVVGLLCLTGWTGVLSMGDDESKTCILKEPAYAPLDDESDVFDGRIVDDGTVTDVTDLSFYGTTSVGGIRREDNDSMTKIDLDHTKALRVVQEAYSSKRHPQHDFALVKKTALDDTEIDGLLVPRHIVICGIEKKSGDKKAWFLGTIDQLIVAKQGQLVTERTEETKVTETKKLISQTEEKEKEAPKTKETKTVTHEFKEDGKTKVVPVTTEYKEKEVKIIEKQPISQQGGVVKAINEFIIAFVNVFRAIWRNIKGLFWT